MIDNSKWCSCNVIRYFGSISRKINVYKIKLSIMKRDIVNNIDVTVKECQMCMTIGKYCS